VGDVSVQRKRGGTPSLVEFSTPVRTCLALVIPFKEKEANINISYYSGALKLNHRRNSKLYHIVSKVNPVKVYGTFSNIHISTVQPRMSL
jgi:hypothetical protein